MGCYVYYIRNCHCKVVFPLLLIAEENMVCLGECIKKKTQHNLSAVFKKKKKKEKSGWFKWETRTGRKIGM